jgi:hypothetical protein
MKILSLAENGSAQSHTSHRAVKIILVIGSICALFLATHSRLVDAARRGSAETRESSSPAPLFVLPNRLTPDELDGEEFGAAMAISGDTLVVGAPKTAVRIGETRFVEAGLAYVFIRDGSEWVQQAKLYPDDAQPLDAFGHSVAISGDTIVIGTRFRDYGLPHEVAGRAYVFQREGMTWTQQAQLTASDHAAEDYFGTAVAINGDTVAIGADGDDVGQSSDQGSVYIFTRGGTSWTERVKILAQDGRATDNFGNSLALSSKTLIVGAKSNDVGANINQGSAYVFTGTGSDWSQQAQLAASDGAPNDEFGVTTAIDGDTVLIGNNRDNAQGAANQSAAYVFVRDGNTWAQQAALASGTEGPFAASAVAVNGDTAVVGTYQTLPNRTSGTQGPVLVFIREGVNWTKQAPLTPGVNGFASQQFGSAVAVSGDTAIVGASHDIATRGLGAAYIFTRFQGTGWHQQARARAEDGAEGDNFGHSVAISGDIAVIGCRDDDIDGTVDQGSAYVFVRKANGWSFQRKLVAPDGRRYDEFGQSVSTDGDTIVIGSDSASGQSYEQGAAYVFRRMGSNWSYQGKLVANDGRRYDYFGRSVAVKGDTIVVGAPLDHRFHQAQGSAYVFTRSGLVWRQSAKLQAADGRGYDYFGVSVAVHNQIIAVGASPFTFNERSHREAVYIFEPGGTWWAQRQKLRALDNAAGFARTIAMDDQTLVAGANEELVDGQTRGSAYVFNHVGRTWVPAAKLSPISLDSGVLLFGNSVSVSGDRIAIGATSYAAASQPYGFFFVFKRIGNTWNQEARLAPPAPLKTSASATPVAISGQTIVAGAGWEKIGTNVNQGAAYIYVYLTGTSWMP